MISDPLNGLRPEFLEKIPALLAGCAAAGYIFQPYFGLRDPLTQARLWRQSRSKAVIDAQILNLRNIGAHFIADCIEKAGPVSGPWATNAIPGLSWHQYGEALDLFLEDSNGKPEWNSPGYAVLGQQAAGFGLTWGGKFKDFDHIQLRSIEPQATFGSLAAVSYSLSLQWPQALGTV